MNKTFLWVCCLNVGFVCAAAQHAEEPPILEQKISEICNALATLQNEQNGGFTGTYPGMYGDANKQFSVRTTIDAIKGWYDQVKRMNGMACQKLQAFVKDHQGAQTALFIGRGSEEATDPQKPQYPWISIFFEEKMKDIPHAQTAYVDPAELAPTYQNPQKANSIIGFWPFQADFTGEFDAVAFDQYVTEHIGSMPSNLHNIINDLRLALTNADSSKADKVDETVGSLREIIFAKDKDTMRIEAIRRAYQAVKPGGVLILPRNPWYTKEQERADFEAAGVTQTGNIVLHELSQEMQNASTSQGDSMTGWFEVTKKQ